MHESTRRWLCRLAFCLVAVFPLIGIIGSSFVMSTPWYREWQRRCWEERLSANIGLDVHLESIEFLAPNQFQAKNATCVHPETRAEIARTVQLDGLMTLSGWQVILTEPVLNGHQLPTAMKVFHDWYLCRPQRSSHLVHARVRDGLTIFHGDSKTKIKRIDFTLQPSESRSGFHCKLELDDQPFGEVGLSVERNHNASSPSTTWTISSPTVSLPCSIAWDHCPHLKSLGNNARFQGEASYALNSEGAQSEICGRFWDIDLTTATFPIGSPIRGSGLLDVAYMRLENGRLIELTSRLSATSGFVQTQWLRSAGEQLGWRFDKNISAAEWGTIEQLVCDIQLNDHGAAIVGRIPDSSDAPGLVMNLISGSVYSNLQYLPTSTVKKWMLSARPISGSESVYYAEVDAFLATTLPLPQIKPIGPNSRTATAQTRKRH